MPVETLAWIEGHIRIIDQTRLPECLLYRDLTSVEALAEAIRSLRIRGAPAIGVAGALGVAMAAWKCQETEREAFVRSVREAIRILASTRPTAVNLFWALNRMEALLDTTDLEAPVAELRDRLVREALRILEEDRTLCDQIGREGEPLIPDGATVLTHCNAGSLATAGSGTALGVLYAAYEAGKRIRVLADETRPLLQGARLTAWELHQSGIPVTVICDSAAAWYMARREVDLVIVGADRIAANGDTANKIGTYGLAVAAHAHGIPFYVAAPTTTFDLSIPDGRMIPIEERSPDELTGGFARPILPHGVKASNPAFDVTPHPLITAIVTERGVIRPPNQETIAALFEGEKNGIPPSR